MSAAWITSELASLPEFERERALLLDSICRDISKWIALGTSLETAWDESARQHTGTRLPNGVNRLGQQEVKTLKLSKQTVRNAWYAWKKVGNATAFKRNFKPGRERMPAELVGEFRRLCTLEGVQNDSAAFKRLIADWNDGKSIPGLGTWSDWYATNHPDHPLPTKAPEFPFTASALQKRAPRGALRRLGNEGVAAMRREAPHVIMDYSKLRPAELYVSDDARLDILIIDEFQGKQSTVRAYLMMEASCRYIVSYVLRPGDAILAADVDEMVKRGLQVCGLGVGYPTHLLFERGTVAISPTKQQLLEQWSEGRIKIHRTGMDGGARYDGATPDKASGHWIGKGVIESFIRKLHLSLMTLPGQLGNTYRNSPANLQYKVTRKKGAGVDGQEHFVERSGGVAAEAEMLAQLDLQFGNRLRLELPIMNLTQLNNAVRDAIKRHNSDPHHRYQDFDFITEAEVQPGVWKPLVTTTHNHDDNTPPSELVRTHELPPTTRES